MKLEMLVDRYIRNAKSAFREIEGKTPKQKSRKKVFEVLQSARRYLEDAQFYRTQKNFETALTSVAYCEGLLDALRILGLVKFQWDPARE
jgi:FAD synthetase